MKQIPVAINGSQQRYNACIMGDTEQAHCQEIAKIVFSNLLKDKLFIPYLVPVQNGTGDTQNLINSVNLSNEFMKHYPSNEFPIRVHQSIHTDAAYAGHGASCFSWGEQGFGKTLRDSVYKEISTFTPWGDMGAKARPELMEMWGTEASSCLAELSFHDQKTEAEFIHKNFIGFANAITLGIYKAVKVVYPEILIPGFLTGQQDDISILVNASKEVGILTDIEYWTKVLKGEIPCNPEYLKIVFSKATKLIK